MLHSLAYGGGDVGRVSGDSFMGGGGRRIRLCGNRMGDREQVFLVGLFGVGCGCMKVELMTGGKVCCGVTDG